MIRKMSRELPQSRYDLSTYKGRVLHTIQITDPRTLLTSRAQLESSRAVVEAYRRGERPLSESVWSAKKVLDATVHPETGLPILLPFRMSCFVLTNLVVTAGMLTPNMGTRGILFWQVTNQSVNVAFNYANANKSSPLTTGEIATSYVLAVVASCGVAVGMNRAVQRGIKSPARRELAGRLVPFVAVAAAGALNVFLMRSGELRTGIDVFSPLASTSKTTAAVTTTTPESETSERVVVVGDGGGGGEEESSSLGKSKRAAFKAIAETAASRVLNSSPIMILPPLLLLAIGRRTRILQRNPRLGLPINLLSIFATSIVALPLAIAAFPTREVMETRSLEDGVRQKVEAKGVTQVVFNRGM